MPPGDVPFEHVTLLEHGEKRLYVLGTAHVSRKSVDEVRAVIRAIRPDTVCVELDEARYEALADESRWERLDAIEILRDGKAAYFLVSLLLSSFQRRMGERLGVRPGAEMLAAAEEAKQIGAELVLADRHIEATLKRSYRSLSRWNRFQLFVAIVASFFARSEITEEQVEGLKDREVLGDALQAFAREMPELQGPLIDERDRYLMSSIAEAPGNTIVAVVGAAHLDGMTRQLGKPVDRHALSELPPPSRVGAAWGALLPVAMLAISMLAWANGGVAAVVSVLTAWSLPGAMLALALTLAAGAHALAAICAACAAPVLGLLPGTRAGAIAGRAQAALRASSLEDRRRLPSDTMSLAGYRRNPFTRILLVAESASLGARIGAWIGAAWALTRL